MFVRGREWDVTEEKQFTSARNRLRASPELKIPKSGFESLLRFLLVGGIQARQFAGPLYIRYSNRKGTTCQDRFSTKSKTHAWNERTARAFRPSKFRTRKESQRVQLRRWSFESSRSISRYSQTRVTIRPNAP